MLSAQNTVATGQPVTAGFNQDFLVENLTIGNGLSDNWINDVFQDSKGFLWIATEDGLNKYDGYRFTIFKHQPGDTVSISHNAVRSILEDQNGVFWFGTRNGLNRFDPLTESFTHFRHDPENPNSLSHNEVLALYEDREGVLWAGALNGLNRFDPQSRQFRLYQHQYPVEKGFGTLQNEIRAITQIPDGRLLIGYWGLGLMFFDKKNESFQPIPVPKHPQPFCINYIEKSPIDSVWIANELIFNQNTPTIASVFLSELLAGVRFNSAFFHSSGNLLIGTFNEGVYVLDKNYQSRQKFKPDPSGLTDPLHNWVRVIFEDRAGGIWLGTAGAGLFHLDLTGNPFANYQSRSDVKNGLIHNNVSALLEVEPDVFWVGTKGYGIQVFDQKKKNFYPFLYNAHNANGLPSNQIRTLYKDRSGDLWIGSWGEGLSRYTPGKALFQHFAHDPADESSLITRFVSTIMETEEGELWVGTSAGISVLPNANALEKKKFKRYRHNPTDSTTLSHHYVRCMLQRQSGIVWKVSTRIGSTWEQKGKSLLPIWIPVAIPSN